MIKLAEESIRRGFPGQAEVAYEKAAAFYVDNNLHRKALSVLKALSALRPEDAETWLRIAEAYLGLGLRRDAAEALRKAAVRLQKNGLGESANTALSRARNLEERLLPEPARPDSIDIQPSEAEVESLVSQALESVSDSEAIHLHLSQPIPVPSLSARPPTPRPPDPEALELELPDAEEDDSAEEEFATEPPRPALQSIDDAQTTYDPNGSSALAEARARIAQRRKTSTHVDDVTRAVDTDEVRRLLARIRDADDVS